MATIAASAVPAACWYDISGKSANGSGLLPMLVVDGATDASQQRVLEYLKCGRSLVLGEAESLPAIPTRLTGSAAAISLALAHKVFDRTAGVMVVRTTQEGYELGLSAAPLASYLDIPVVLAPQAADWMGWSQAATR